MSDEALREDVLYLLKAGGAHLNFEKAIVDLPEEFRGKKVEGASHTPWRLLEHLRICQWDILEFSRNPKQTELYVRLRDKAQQEGWLEKLSYLLYEDGVAKEDAAEYRGLKGVLLQSKPRDDGKSRNRWIAALQ